MLSALIVCSKALQIFWYMETVSLSILLDRLTGRGQPSSVAFEDGKHLKAHLLIG